MLVLLPLKETAVLSMNKEATNGLTKRQKAIKQMNLVVKIHIKIHIKICIFKFSWGKNSENIVPLSQIPFGDNWRY